MDRYLIILRGVPGAGKTQVAKVILGRIGEKAVRWNLDDYAPDPEQGAFDAKIKQMVGKTYIVGELYSGRKHTSDPTYWIDHFKGGYSITSFVLQVSEPKGYANACDSRHTSWHPETRTVYDNSYNRFQEHLKNNTFASKAGIKEVFIDAEDGNWERLASEVLKLSGLAS